MNPKTNKIGILHYSAPPVIGGVENVIEAHARLFTEAGYPTTAVAGRGVEESLPSGTNLILVPELDSKHPQILEISQSLEQGNIPPNFEVMVDRLVRAMSVHLGEIDTLIVHNVFTKHFNLPLTAALFRLLDQRVIRDCVAWCHDLSWTSAHSRPKIHEGYPWDLLRTFRSDLQYVTISQDRQKDLAGLLGCAPEKIRIIYNGVDPKVLLALSDAGRTLTDRLGLWESELNLLMPVRVTQAKNVELAIRLVAALKEKGVHPRLTITGPPDPHDRMNIEYFQELLNLREQLGVTEELRFVYQSGKDPSKPYIVDMSVVAELFRVSDALFMPSHREGSGMPIIEAGLVGLPIFCSDTIPAAYEIASKEVTMFHPDIDPRQLADIVLTKLTNDPVHRHRMRVRQRFTWQGIFQHEILSLLKPTSP